METDSCVHVRQRLEETRNDEYPDDLAPCSTICMCHWRGTHGSSAKKQSRGGMQDIETSVGNFQFWLHIYFWMISCWRAKVQKYRARALYAQNGLPTILEGFVLLSPRGGCHSCAHGPCFEKSVSSCLKHLAPDLGASEVDSTLCKKKVKVLKAEHFKWRGRICTHTSSLKVARRQHYRLSFRGQVPQHNRFWFLNLWHFDFFHFLPSCFPQQLSLGHSRAVIWQGSARFRVKVLEGSQVSSIGFQVKVPEGSEVPNKGSK